MVPQQFNDLIEDMSQAKRRVQHLEQSVQHLEQRVQQLQTMTQAKDDFLATVSHELMTPLNTILGWTELLRAGSAGLDDFRLGIEAIARNAALQARIIGNLADSTQLDGDGLKLTLVPVDLRCVMRQAVAGISVSAEAKSVALRTQMDGSVGAVLGDGERLRQAIWNLLANALKFSIPGGTIEISLAQVCGRAEIIVKDSGLGIPEDKLGHIFERLPHGDGLTKRRTSGLGVGLAITKHLVEAHGGQVKVASPGAGQGATFVIVLPIAAPGPDVAPSPWSESGRTEPLGSRLSRLSGLRVLVVDDHADALILAKLLLERAGAQVDTVTNGRAAIATAMKAPPDVVVCDLNLPEEDGVTLLKRLRRSLDLSPFRAIALTAFADRRWEEEALRGGFDAYLLKPFQPTRLVAMVAELGARVTQVTQEI